MATYAHSRLQTQIGIHMNRLRTTKTLLLGLTLAAFATGRATAQNIFVQGNAQGCFGLGCVPSESDAITLSGVLLSYSSQTPVDFTGTTQDGLLAISSLVGNFGVLSVGTASVTTSINSVFNLLVTFSSPTADNPISFDVLIQGKVRNTAQGGVVVDFDPVTTVAGQVNNTSGWVPFYDVNTDQYGNIRLTAYGTSIPSGGSASLIGLVEATTTTPEPASIVMMSTGLFGLFGAARRRRGQTSEATS
jgi:hypothetical protein